MSKIETKKFILKDGRKGIIRTATKDDAESILQIMKSVFAEAKYTVTTLKDNDENFTIEKTSEWISKHLDSDEKLYLVAEINGHVVGSVDLHNDERKRIQHIATVGITVAKKFRGYGIGKALMDSLIEWASNSSVIEKVTLAVFANNERAINLYKKLDFIEEGCKVREIKIGENKYVDSVLMYKCV